MQRNLIGEQLGHYRLTSLLGQGGFAEVYLGEHTRLTSKVAIKVLHAHLPPKERERFQREAQIIAALKHPHIVRVLDFDVQNGLPFLIMDYYPTGTVRQVHPRGSPIPLEKVATYTRQVADALQYAHAQKLIHRDVKPQNMLIGQQGDIALSDFGIATIAHNSSSMSGRQGPIGTIAYMAPEQIQAQARPASDQYALAIAVYEWLCGKRPFDGTYVELIARHLSTPPPSLSQQVAISPAIEQVVLTALAKDPHQRYPSIQEFARAMESAIQQAPPRRLSVVFPADNSRKDDEEKLLALGQIEPPRPDSPPELPSANLNATIQATPSSDSSPSLPSPVRKAPTGRKSYRSLLAGILLLFLLTGLVIIRVQVNATATVLSAATAGSRAGTATAASDMATASTQQTVSVFDGYATATARVYASATATVRDRSPSYFSGRGQLSYNEALDSAGYYWDNHSDSHGGSCQFADNSYHISETNAGGSYLCADLDEVFGGNALVEVETMIIKGDCAALHMRYRINTGDTYPFRVCSNGSALIADHTSGRDIILGSVGPGSFTLQAGWNIIGLETTINNTIMGYVNGKRVLTVNDDGPSRIGNLALAAVSINAATEVAYRHLRVWL